MYEVLKGLGKKVDIVCSSNALFDNVNFLKNYTNIQTDVDFSKFNFSNYDLFITLDSSSWGMVVGDASIPIPKIPITVIDHHKTNPKYGSVNLIDDKVQSVAELLYLLFRIGKLS